MTHDHTPDTTDVAASFAVADGWAIVRQVLVRIGETFSPHGRLALLLAPDVAARLLAWLKPAEELARKLLFVMAHALDVAALGQRRKAAKRNPASTIDIAVHRCATFRLASARDAVAALRRGGARRHTPIEDERRLWYGVCDPTPRSPRHRRSARAGASTRSQLSWPLPPHRPSTPLARRIDALLRLAANPSARALRLARRLNRATPEAAMRLAKPFRRPCDRRRAGICPAGLSLTDQLIALIPDTS